MSLLLLPCCCRAAAAVSAHPQGPGLACLERLLAGPPSTEAVAGAGMQGSSSSKKRYDADTAEPAAAAGTGADLSDVGGREGPHAAAGGGDGDSGDNDDGRIWFVGDKISIADIAVADLVRTSWLGLLSF